MEENFYIVDKNVLPDVYKKVVKAKKILKEGKVKEVTEAVKIVGISRSVYYKYKDSVFEFSEKSKGRKATFTLLIKDMTGVLSEILNYISKKGGNILTINQGIPINGYANVSLTIDMTMLKGDIKTLLSDLSKINFVDKVEFIAME